MMKKRSGCRIKKLVALVLSATLILSLGVLPVYAADSADGSVENTSNSTIPSPEELVKLQGGNKLNSGSAALGAKSVNLKKPSAVYTKKWARSKQKGQMVQYRMRWNAVSNATGYETQLSSSRSFAKSYPCYTTNLCTYCKMKNKSVGKTWFYRVRAFKISGSKVYYGPWYTIKFKATW